MYVIFSPTLVTAVMKNENISLDPIAFGFNLNVQGSRRETLDACARPEYNEKIMRMLHTSLMGENLRAMNAPALRALVGDLNSMVAPDTLQIKDLWDWVQRQTVRSAHEALYGENNPVTWEIWEDIRTWADSMPALALGFAQNTLAPHGLAARKRVQEALRPFYANRYDQHMTASRFVADRAQLLRDIGISDSELASSELFLPWVSVVNTAPAIMWLLCEVFAREDCVERVAMEVHNIVKIDSATGKKRAFIDVTRLGKDCDFLDQCFTETMRRYNTVVGVRRVMEDTQIQDIDGQVYFLKKGADIQWTAGGAHRNKSAFGEDAADWRPDRWSDPSLKTSKFQRENLVIFGRGKHICPGRMMATLEAKALVAVLALGFEVQGVSVPSEEVQPLTEVIRSPTWEGGEVKITRKKGWEDVEWVFNV
ncbi:prostacyclin synthase [Fusarium heterosporum]|uniref:Prostacyclin synthase n=1 Tax=Fusarium heterosporum TaxID=42747 RepID=A0A8H5TTG3_FUSHE|nr:prostacyclin synthase [Fusarium heterosporum]